MPVPVALCALCGERVCAHDDFQFAGFEPADRGSSAGVRAGAALPASAHQPPRSEAGSFSDHSFAHAATSISQEQRNHG